MDNRRRNLEMYDFHKFCDRAIAAVMWAVIIALLIFTGAGSVMWHGLADTVAAWWLL